MRRWVVVGAMLITTGCGSTDTTQEYDTIDEILASPDDFADGEVRLRGWRRLQIVTTLALCGQATCDCNDSSGQLELTAERDAPGGEPWVTVAQVVGVGNQCENVFPLLDPSGIGYELVGRLRVPSSSGAPNFVLEDLDLGASRQLVGSADDLGDLEAVPLELGAHVCRCPVGDFFACYETGVAFFCSDS